MDDSCSSTHVCDIAHTHYSIFIDVKVVQHCLPIQPKDIWRCRNPVLAQVFVTSLTLITLFLSLLNYR